MCSQIFGDYMAAPEDDHFLDTFDYRSLKLHVTGSRVFFFLTFF